MGQWGLSSGKVERLQSLNFSMISELFYWPKIIYIIIAKSSFTVFDIMILTAVKANVICFERMVIEQWLKLDMKRDLKGFLCSFGAQ